MEDNVIPNPHDLKKMPLAEVIFELRWTLVSRAPDISFDPGFRVFLGRYYDRVREKYPRLEDLPISRVPEDMTAHVVRHRFRVGDNQWPVTQVGPGVITVNETKGYKWTTFRPLVLDAIGALFALYPKDIASLSPMSVELKYINAISYDPPKNNLLAILSDLLHTKVEVDPILFKDPWEADQPEVLNLSLTLPLKNFPAVGNLLFATGTSDNKPAFIWDISIRSVGAHVPQAEEKFSDWLTNAHHVADKWFFGLCRGDLLKTFE